MLLHVLTSDEKPLNKLYRVWGWSDANISYIVHLPFSLLSKKMPFGRILLLQVGNLFLSIETSTQTFYSTPYGLFHNKNNGKVQSNNGFYYQTGTFGIRLVNATDYNYSQCRCGVQDDFTYSPSFAPTGFRNDSPSPSQFLGTSAPTMLPQTSAPTTQWYLIKERIFV